MKWRQRSVTCSLLAGLILSISSCEQAQPSVHLLAVKQLDQFPSASAIEYHNNKIYLFGDDAAFLIVLDSAYNQLDSIHYRNDTAYRVPKSRKDDIEAATAFPYNGRESMIAFGSMSMQSRTRAFVFPIEQPHQVDSFSLQPLFSAIKGVREVNVEGAVMVGDRLLFANRANEANPVNQLIIVDDYRQLSGKPVVSTLVVALPSKDLSGLSGIHYVAESDQLFFTASQEATSSALEDGAIGTSYLGWIDHFSQKLKQKTVQPDVFVSLPTVDPAFKGQKIEAICATQEVKGNDLEMTLASDNDNGKSTLYKIRINL